MATQKKVAPKLKSDVKETMESLPTMSAKIRYLSKQGFERADVARILNIRYQWVRNVLETRLASES